MSRNRSNAISTPTLINCPTDKKWNECKSYDTTMLPICTYCSGNGSFQHDTLSDYGRYIEHYKAPGHIADFEPRTTYRTLEAYEELLNEAVILNSMLAALFTVDNKLYNNYICNAAKTRLNELVQICSKFDIDIDIYLNSNMKRMGTFELDDMRKYKIPRTILKTLMEHRKDVTMVIRNDRKE